MRSHHAIILAAAMCCMLVSRDAFAAGCNDRTPQAVTQVELPGSPFTPIPTRDGCWIFVALPNTVLPQGAAVAVLKRLGGQIAIARVVPVEGAPTGMVLSHDGALLIVADTSRVAFLDVQRLISGSGGAVLGYWTGTERNPGHIYVNATRDDRYLFVSNEGAQSISVLDLAKARQSGFSSDSFIGNIPVGRAPIALTFSSDERFLFSTSELMSPDAGWPIECRPEENQAAPPRSPQGAIFVIDVKRATSNPATGVVGTVKAGCSPVRLVTSPKGDVAYVTARGDHSLLMFDTDKLVHNPSVAFIGKVRVGTAPVGVAVVDQKHVVATSSNRFGGNGLDKQSLYVIDVKKTPLGPASVVGVIPAGGFPREIRVTADGKTLLVTNFTSRTLEIVDLSRWPLQPVPTAP